MWGLTFITSTFVCLFVFLNQTFMQVFYETGKRQVQGGNRRKKHFLIQLCATEVEAEKCLIRAERTRCTWTAGREERGRVCTVCNESSEEHRASRGSENTQTQTPYAYSLTFTSIHVHTNIKPCSIKAADYQKHTPLW